MGSDFQTLHFNVLLSQHTHMFLCTPQQTMGSYVKFLCTQSKRHTKWSETFRHMYIPKHTMQKKGG